jgi:hypothetical protein
LSEFIKRIQDRLKSSQQALEQKTGTASKQGKLNNAQGALTNSMSWLNYLNWLNPANTSKALTYLLMLACAISATYWLMKMIQIPGTPKQASNGITNGVTNGIANGIANGTAKGLTLYSNQDASAAYGLFGSKPLVTENIYLRGVVVTSKNLDGTLDGFAIFEIDGKSTNAISVGETIGKGLSLQSIGDEQATLLYQGQKLNFKLNKPNKDKGDKSGITKVDTTNKK